MRRARRPWGVETTSLRRAFPVRNKNLGSDSKRRRVTFVAFHEPVIQSTYLDSESYKKISFSTIFFSSFLKNLLDDKHTFCLFYTFFPRVLFYPCLFLAFPQLNPFALTDTFVFTDRSKSDIIGHNLSYLNRLKSSFIREIAGEKFENNGAEERRRETPREMRCEMRSEIRKIGNDRKLIWTRSTKFAILRRHAFRASRRLFTFQAPTSETRRIK